MALSAMHHNGAQVVSIDIKTTGPDPSYHEIGRIAFIPLDSFFRVRKDVMPLIMRIAPEHPERYDRENSWIKLDEQSEIAKSGFDAVRAIDMFEEWVLKLKLGFSKYGTPKRIIPLCYDYVNVKPYIRHWLGIETYKHYFEDRNKDTKVVAEFLNDHYSALAENVPYPKTDYGYIANVLRIEKTNIKDPFERARMTAEVYRRMTEKYLI